MATREVAVIKDRETGDINELRDKKLADSTARTTSGDVQTTDSIRMLDTSGNEVYIARDSFMAAVKSCLGNIINSSTLKTEAPKTLVLDSGGDLGAVQPSTLASVLSEPLNVHVSANGITSYERWYKFADFYPGAYNRYCVIRGMIYNYTGSLISELNIGIGFINTGTASFCVQAGSGHVGYVRDSNGWYSLYCKVSNAGYALQMITTCPPEYITSYKNPNGLATEPDGIVML